MPHARIFAALLTTAVLTACGAAQNGLTQSSFGARLPPVGHASKIEHVVLVIQENRSFDDFFATFPGADGTTTGKTSDGKTVPLQQVDLAEPCDFGHSYSGFLKDYDGGKMDGFDLEGGSKKCPGKAGLKPYQYVDPAQIASYWDIAEQWVLADHLFQTQGSGSFTAHQDLIAGGTAIDPTKSIVDFPSHEPWGCDAPAGTLTSVLIGAGVIVRSPQGLRYRYDGGPFPCFAYATLRDVLDAKSVGWKYYSPPVHGATGAIWNAFDAIAAVRNGPEWNTNVTSNNKIFFDDITHGTLPAVSWLVPDNENSDHPGDHYDTGPSWVADVVNSVGQSPYWRTTAVVVVWDDWGGFYEHVPPPFFDNAGGLGFRVPMLVVSPYARLGSPSGGYISHTQYEFGSILRFIEDNFGLGRIGTTDIRATSIGDCFDFSQRPRKFTPIAAKYSRGYFERQRPSYRPVDTE
ncbi:MAG TPA: alkaline phosphatase family protein [Candidatus Nitrosotalea sp.]|nr:alkaline phosphatase family protein [Candidatus Nitrosotalea sp.]